MNARLSRQCVPTAALAAALGVLLASTPYFKAIAADSSSWDGDVRSAMRLVTGGRLAGDPSGNAWLRAGVEIRLAAGWKTYWRYPGDSGVPPTFDFSKSENVKSVLILWPSPHRFTDEGGASIGYKSDVMFPLHVVPQNPSRPVKLRLSLDYAVCEKLCVPARGEAAVSLASSPSAQDARVAEAEARTPKPARLGDVVSIGIPAAPGEPRISRGLGNSGAALGIIAVRREPGHSHPRIVVEVTAPDVPLDLFVEGPTADWALPLPDTVPGAPAGRHWFAFDLDGAPPGVDATGVALRFTLTAGENAIEVTAVPK